MARLFDNPQTDAPPAPKKRKKERPRNELWDIVAEVFAWDERCETHASLIGKTAAELKVLDATTDEVRRRYAVLCREYKNPGPIALVKHWNRLGKPSNGTLSSKVSTVDEANRKRQLETLRSISKNEGYELKDRAARQLGCECPADWHRDVKWVHTIYILYLQSIQPPKPPTGNEIPF